MTWEVMFKLLMQAIEDAAACEDGNGAVIYLNGYAIALSDAKEKEGGE
ncbi:MAG: hypothetical protein MJZ81_07790 [Bacteroidales bacterium]|nr:hypothetical protein [Bacteroidales bacterium]